MSAAAAVTTAVAAAVAVVATGAAEAAEAAEAARAAAAAEAVGAESAANEPTTMKFFKILFDKTLHCLRPGGSKENFLKASWSAQQQLILY